ncbi:Peroxisomal membrane protein PEX13 [Atta colombica]|uniref:Peroxisomal membrane protein PEX13 n=1 Tax=Atta colombica TaxID=520822 RepID=A0A195BF76_9HYME|nr:PREDICTED: peroxisomal membrane protein PEX13 [Atta colombica]XP_018048270.1 PREDICTED: peroxisomal membrane protein PEX13 [Atta colombica]KYM82864.1 Peroxisomal membrane protein PEX13 [Atta colombica]
MAPGRSNIINSNQLRNSSFSSSMPGQSSFQTGAGAIPPPLPPRQPAQSYLGYNDYRPYGSNYGYGNYGNYGYGGYRGYGGYGSFGSYIPYSGNSYGQIGGHSGDVENRFQQYAEESTRSTFRVVETVLHTFSSITMLLESTYFALTNSFRAILSVADNIGRLRSTIGQLLSTFALIRVMKWIYKKILFTLGLQTQNAVVEDLWQQSVSQLTNGEQTPITATNERISPWMNILLLGVFVAIPYLIHKITSNIRQNQIKVNDPKEWVKCEDPICVATAMYDFMAVSNEELSLRTGQKIWLAPRSLQSKSIPGWWIATDNRNVGLVPANYVTIVGQLKRKPESESNGNVITSTVIPTSMQNAIASDEQVNTVEPNIGQQNTDFSENNIKDDLF